VTLPPLHAVPPDSPQPSFWTGRLEHVRIALDEVTRGQASPLTESPGGRVVYRVDYGSPVERRQQANYNSAAGAGDPGYYTGREPGSPPVVLIIGGIHGHEVEGIVGLVNLMHLVETGHDYRGREWPGLAAAMERCRTILVPVANPDGRARCPRDSFIGVPVSEMSRIGQGTRADGSLYGWPGVKQVHPMTRDGGLLGAYFNDHGVNLMHDNFFAPMAPETRALLGLAADEAPDVILNLHSHGSVPVMLSTAYVPQYCKIQEAAFAVCLAERYRAEGLPTGGIPNAHPDGNEYPPPSFNLTSALHHVCGGLSMLFESPHGLAEPGYTQVTPEEILDLHLLLFDEFFNLALGMSPSKNVPGSPPAGKTP
jgi:hypothetical protein